MTNESGQFHDQQTPTARAENRAVSAGNCPNDPMSPANTGILAGSFSGQLPNSTNCPPARIYRYGSGQCQVRAVSEGLEND